MRYLAIAAAALIATTSFASADSMTVAAGPMQLSAAQLDDVSAGGRKWRRPVTNITKNIRTITQTATITQNANATATNTVSGTCVGACFSLAVGGANVLVGGIAQAARN